MIQGGDPTGTGYGGPGYSIEDEFDTRARNNQKTISMANAGPNTGGSQFFINLKNNNYLDNRHAVFGTTIEGFDIVEKIGKVSVNGSDRPLEDVVMDSLRIVSNTSIDDELYQIEAKIFPNPISSESIIALENNNTELVEVTLYSEVGERLGRFKHLLNVGINQIQLRKFNLSILGNGVYHIRISGENKFTSLKFVIIR
jgi:hypothetical protein